MVLKVLSASDIRRSLSMTAAIEAVESAFVQYSSGQSNLPPRAHITPDAAGGTTLFMPAYLPWLQAFGAKIISIFPSNISRRIPTIHALVLLLDPQTGVPLGILDGTTLTALRTGAASGVATKHLSRPEASVVAILGAGVQARTQLEAVCTVRRIKTIFVFDSRPELSRAFAEEFSAQGGLFPGDIRVSASSSEAVRQADIICSATTSQTPVFQDADLKPGVHINAIGSYEPHVQEIPAETVCRSKVVVDSIEASLAETGDFLIPLKAGLFRPAMIHGEIGNVASGSLDGRSSPQEMTLFKSVGLAVQDISAGHRALEEADRLGLGTIIEI